VLKGEGKGGVKVGNVRVGGCPSVPGDATVYSVVRAAAARNVCRGKVNEGCYRSFINHATKAVRMTRDAGIDR